MMKTKGDEASITLRLFGEKIDIEEISQVLKLRPTKSWKKGKEIGHISGKAVERKTGCWIYKMNTEFQSPKLNEFLSKFDLLGPIAEVLPNIERAKLSIHFSHLSEIDGGGAVDFFLENETVKMIAFLGFDFSVTTVYGPN
jgi:hypothetical protein